MYSRLKQSKRALSFILALVLVLNIVLSSGFFRVAVQAADEDAPSAVFYVDGVGSGNEDGSSADNAFKTIAQAYQGIPAGNKKTVIVICGNVSMRAADAGIALAGSSSMNYYAAPDVCHEGEVVFTSVYGGVDYRTQSAGLQLALRYMLMGDTTFEDITITNRAYVFYANYYDLCIGEGVALSGVDHFAESLYLGTSQAIHNAIRDDVNVDLTGIFAQDVTFTMKSSVVINLYGCGNSHQGDSNYGKSFGANLNVEGGTVTKLSVENGNGTTKISDLNVTIGNASVGTLILGTNGVITDENKVITYKNKTGAVSVAGFDALELVNSSVTVSSLDTVKTIQTTDNSSLTVETAPTEAIPVTVTKAGHKWVSNGALITAPADTAENMFVLTESGDCVWKYANGTNATWTVEGDPDAFYVDGVNGDDTNDGLTAAAPLKTLTAAYAKIDANNKVTYIVICGEVHLADSLVNASASVTNQVIGKHAGTVVLTSKYKNNDYRGEGVGLYLGKANWDLLGDTALENIDIKENANRITANYYSFYMGEGIGGDLVTTTIVLGFNGNAMFNNSVITTMAHDIVFTMKSGTIGTLYGQGLNNQGWKNVDTNASYVPVNATLNIEGGTITDRVYMATNPSNASVNNVTLNIGGNANVPKVQGYYQTPTVKGELACVADLAGKNKELICNDNKFNLYVINTAYGAADGTNAAYLDTTGGYTSGDFIQKITQDPDSKMRYAVIQNGAEYTPHPFNLTFAQVGLNTKAGANDDEVAICLRAMYLAGDKVKPSDFGISHLEGGEWKNYSAVGSAYSFEGKNLVNAFYNLSGALDSLDSTNSYRVYMVVNGVTVYSDYIAEITPCTVLTNINNQLLAGGYVSDTQRTSLEALVTSKPAVGEILTYFN